MPWVVGVDEAGYDIAVARIDLRRPSDIDVARLDDGDPSCVENEGTFAEHAVRQYHVAPGEDDHRPSQSTCT